MFQFEIKNGREGKEGGNFLGEVRKKKKHSTTLAVVSGIMVPFLTLDFFSHHSSVQWQSLSVYPTEHLEIISGFSII